MQKTIVLALLIGLLAIGVWLFAAQWFQTEANLPTRAAPVTSSEEHAASLEDTTAVEHPAALTRTAVSTSPSSVTPVAAKDNTPDQSDTAKKARSAAETEPKLAELLDQFKTDGNTQAMKDLLDKSAGCLSTPMTDFGIQLHLRRVELMDYPDTDLAKMQDTLIQRANLCKQVSPNFISSLEESLLSAFEQGDMTTAALYYRFLEQTIFAGGSMTPESIRAALDKMTDTAHPMLEQAAINGDIDALRILGQEGIYFAGVEHSLAYRVAYLLATQESWSDGNTLEDEFIANLYFHPTDLDQAQFELILARGRELYLQCCG